MKANGYYNIEVIKIQISDYVTVVWEGQQLRLWIGYTFDES
jgi:hypothetical protein